MSAFPAAQSPILPKNNSAVHNIIRREGAFGLYQKDYNAYDPFDNLVVAGGVAAGNDTHFSLAGANTPLASLLPGGGNLLTTGATSTNPATLFPYATSTFGDPILATPATGQVHVVEWQINTGAAITAKQIYVGLKLSDTGVIATDADQLLLLYDTSNTANFGPAGVGTLTASANWYIVYSIAGTDVAFDTGIAVAAATDYRLSILINADGSARVYVNGLLKFTTPVLTITASFKPAAGVTTRASATKTLGVRGVRVSRNFA